jgi:tRNA (adenine37-N6)-methyltransferase
MTELNLPIIGYMKSPYKEKFGIPRQPNLVQVESYIEMVAPYNDLLAFEGIHEFSHLWLVWQFHDNKNQQEKDKFRPQVRPPRLGGNKKIGVFATRSMYRPSPIGLSVVQLKEVSKEGKSLRVYVTGSDLLDGTPILDIKPYIRYSDSIENAESGYAQDEPNRKHIIWSQEAEKQKFEYIQRKQDFLRIFHELEQILSLDPRPAYQDDEERVYGLSFSEFNVQFKVQGNSIHILKL